MGRQLTLLILLVALPAAGFKWVLISSAKDAALTNQANQLRTTSQPGVRLDEKPIDSDHSGYRHAHSSYADNPDSVTSAHSSQTQLPDQLVAIAAFSPSDTVSEDATPSPEKLTQLLANQGIVLDGIDHQSSHADALFAAYFNQSENTGLALEIILGDLAKNQPAQAWQWIISNDDTGLLHQFRATIIQHWLPIDANAALLAIMNLAPSDDKDIMLADYAAFVAIEEPERAFYWAYALSSDKSRRQALDRVVYEWASSDPEQAILHMDTIIEPEIRRQLLFQAGPTITAQLTQVNPYRAMLWTSSLNKYENEFLSPIAFQQWINKNPDEAINWLTGANNFVNTEQYMASAATTLPYQNLSLAMEVFPKMNTSVQQNMASPIAFSLYQQDPNDAMLWSNNLQDPILQRSANRGILLASVNTEPEVALQMALDYTVVDGVQVLINTAIEVDQQHPEILERWLLTAPITDNQANKIIEALVRSPAD